MKTKFMAAHQQAGDFQVQVKDGQVVQKNGGNVASYFCTPDGRVINAVLGPAGANDLLHEAEWAIKVYESAESSGTGLQKALADAHRTAQGRGQQSRQVHQLLAAQPLPGLDEIYRQVFALLGEGERAKGLDSPDVLALEDDNARLRDEVRRRSERLDGNGSAKLLRERDENQNLRYEAQRLKDIEEERKKEFARTEGAAFNRLRAASTYLEKGDKDKAKEVLETILKNYAETKAAKTAAKLLAGLASSATSTATTQ